MKLIDQAWQYIDLPHTPLKLIERIGRTCYKSEDRITSESAEKFVKSILDSGHESVIEHSSVSVRFITNRGVTHELVRHRLCAFSQESTRYVRYSGSMEFIRPVWYGQDKTADSIFESACRQAEWNYEDLLERGWRPEQAREVLPNSLKTEICVTANMREWRHILKLRTSKRAHPQMRALMKDCLDGFHMTFPVLFDDLWLKLFENEPA